MVKVYCPSLSMVFLSAGVVLFSLLDCKKIPLTKDEDLQVGADCGYAVPAGDRKRAA
jgi:hypothetical protein